MSPSNPSTVTGAKTAAKRKKKKTVAQVQPTDALPEETAQPVSDALPEEEETGTPVISVLLNAKNQPFHYEKTLAPISRPGTVRIEPTAWLLGGYTQRRCHGYSNQQDNESPLAAAAVGTVVESTSEKFKTGQPVLATGADLDTIADVPESRVEAIPAVEHGYLSAMPYASVYAAFNRVLQHVPENTEPTICVVGDSYAARILIGMLEAHRMAFTHFVGYKLSLLDGKTFDILFDCRDNADFINAASRVANDGQYVAFIIGNMTTIELASERGVKATVLGFNEPDYATALRHTLKSVCVAPAFMSSHPAAKFIATSNFYNIPAAVASNGGYYLITRSK